MNKEDNRQYAVKIMKKKALMRRRFGMRKGTAYEDVLREISIMKDLDHKNIVKLYEVINDPNEDRLFLVVEYAEGGPVMKGEMETEPLPEAKAKKYFLDVVCGLAYLHEHKITHRDIKVRRRSLGFLGQSPVVLFRSLFSV